MLPAHICMTVLFIWCRWVEFTKKGVAKRVANMLNGEQIGMDTLAGIILAVSTFMIPK